MFVNHVFVARWGFRRGSPFKGRSLGRLESLVPKRSQKHGSPDAACFYMVLVPLRHMQHHAFATEPEPKKHLDKRKSVDVCGIL